MTRRWILTGVVLASLGAACQLEHNLSIPPDARVDAAPWSPPMQELGEPGWRESTEPWAPGEHKDIWEFSLWSHPGGVFVLFKGGIDLPSGLSEVPERIWTNTGAGWSVYLEGRGFTPDTMWINRIRGFPRGEPLGSGDDSEPAPVMHLPPTGAAQGVGTSCYDVFVVNDSLAYAVSFDTIFRFDGTTWATVASPPSRPGRLWADEETLFTSGGLGLMRLQDGVWTEFGTGTEGGASIWGFSPTDVWMGGVAGSLWHFDGTAVTQVAWPNPYPEDLGPNLDHVWGADGVLYLAMDTVVARGEAGEFERLAEWGCAPLDDFDACPWLLRIHDLWGNGPDEVFVAVTQGNTAYLLRWDGTEFHWF
jgi:hypothetical protein